MLRPWHQKRRPTIKVQELAMFIIIKLTEECICFIKLKTDFLDISGYIYIYIYYIYIWYIHIYIYYIYIYYISGVSRIWWKGGVNCHKQGQSRCLRHEMASGGGSGRGVSPIPMWKKMEIRKCLEDFWSTPKSVFCMAILYKYWQNTFLTTKLYKNRSSFFIILLEGGGGARAPWIRHCIYNTIQYNTIQGIL